MLVREHINFERGQDPIKAMGIGNIEFIKSLDWGKSVNIEAALKHYDIISFIQYKGFYLLTIESKERYNFVTLTSPHFTSYNNSHFCNTPEKAKDIIIRLIDTRKF
jgi:hypothetical protein